MNINYFNQITQTDILSNTDLVTDIIKISAKIGTLKAGDFDYIKRRGDNREH